MNDVIHSEAIQTTVDPAPIGVASNSSSNEAFRALIAPTPGVGGDKIACLTLDPRDPDYGNTDPAAIYVALRRATGLDDTSPSVSGTPEASHAIWKILYFEVYNGLAQDRF